MRADRGVSLGDLAGELHYHRGSIGNIEKGGRFPDLKFAELADRALHAGGALVRAWKSDHAARDKAEHDRRILECAVSGSNDIHALTEPTIDLDAIDHGVRSLAVAYLGSPAMPVLEQACALRSEITFRLREEAFRPAEQVDLLLAAGRLSGVLAYAALDLGHPAQAYEHTEAAWRCAGATGDGELAAWVRGTQSLIARFDERYDDALALALDGQKHASTRGTGMARLLSGEAQCHANLQDSTGANALLDLAEHSWAVHEGEDSVGGLFAFSEAKLRYYAGSSLIWLDGKADARRAAREASEAISLWSAAPADCRSLDDEALAHVYLATARLQLGEVEGAMNAVRPILELPAERQISWITKRLARLIELLDRSEYKGSLLASSAREELRAHASEPA